MKQYLDLISLINSDFYKKNQRLSWHINHVEYCNFNENLFNFLEKIEFTEREDIIFQLAKTSIYKSMTDYLSHVYDYTMLSSNNVQTEYSSNSKSYLESIWKKKNYLLSHK